MSVEKLAKGDCDRQMGLFIQENAHTCNNYSQAQAVGGRSGWLRRGNTQAENQGFPCPMGKAIASGAELPQQSLQSFGHVGHLAVGPRHFAGIGSGL